MATTTTLPPSLSPSPSCLFKLHDLIYNPHYPHPFCLTPPLLTHPSFFVPSVSFPRPLQNQRNPFCSIPSNTPLGYMPQAPSTRWCPTPEQLMILEEMYRSGIRTPNAAQIQQITAHLSYYGKIEGKNVFYWFQNHKARDRQKMRRRLSRHQQLLQQHHQINGQPQLQCQQQSHFQSQSQSHPPQLFQMELLPHTPLLPHHLSFPHNPPPQENNISSPAMLNLVSKLEACGRKQGGGEMEMMRWSSPMETTSSSFPTEDDLMMTMVDQNNIRLTTNNNNIVGGGSFPLPCCRPLKTLDLFPTNSTGSLLLQRDEYGSTSCKSSSCSTSTTN